MIEINFKIILEIISNIKNFHKEIRKLIDISKEDRKHAIYLLQGGALSYLIYAYDFNNEGYIVPLAQQYRMILETIELILFFNELDDGSRYIKAFFKGHTIRIKQGNSGNPDIEDRIKISGLTEERLNRSDDLYKNLFNIGSDYMHPNLESIRAKLINGSYIFDYERKFISKPYKSAIDFNKLFLIPVIHGFLLPINTIPFNELDYSALKYFLEKHK